MKGVNNGQKTGPNLREEAGRQGRGHDNEPSRCKEGISRDMSEAKKKSPQRIPVSSKKLRLSGDGLDGVLLGMKCNNCGEYFLSAPNFCANCTSDDLEEVELSKHGTLRSYTVVHTPPPGWQGNVPYILGSVELPEGPSIRSEVVDCPQQSLKVGMPVDMVLRVAGKDKEENEVVVYSWKPASE